MISVLAGSNSFLIQEQQRKLIRDFTEQYGDLALEKFDGEEASFEAMRAAVESMPFLSPKKLVLLHQPSLNKDFAVDFAAMLTDAPDTTDLVIIEPKLDKRTGYYKFLKKLEGFKEFTELDQPALVTWANEYLAKWQATIDRPAINELISRTGADQLRLKNELDKLAMYRNKIDLEAVKELTASSPSSTIFELLDAAFAGNKKRTIQLYEEQRMLRVDPMQIIAMLAWQFHVLAIIAAAGEKPEREIAQAAKLNPFVVSKSRRITSSMKPGELKKLIRELRLLDTRLKTTRIDADEALQAYLLSI